MNFHTANGKMEMLPPRLAPLEQLEKMDRAESEVSSSQSRVEEWLKKTADSDTGLAGTDNKKVQSLLTYGQYSLFTKWTVLVEAEFVPATKFYADEGESKRFNSKRREPAMRDRVALALTKNWLVMCNMENLYHVSEDGEIRRVGVSLHLHKITPVKYIRITVDRNFPAINITQQGRSKRYEFVDQHPTSAERWSHVLDHVIAPSLDDDSLYDTLNNFKQWRRQHVCRLVIDDKKEKDKSASRSAAYRTKSATSSFCDDESKYLPNPSCRHASFAPRESAVVKTTIEERRRDEGVVPPSAMRKEGGKRRDRHVTFSAINSTHLVERYRIQRESPYKAATFPSEQPYTCAKEFSLEPEPLLLRDVDHKEGCEIVIGEEEQIYTVVENESKHEQATEQAAKPESLNEIEDSNDEKHKEQQRESLYDESASINVGYDSMNSNHSEVVLVADEGDSNEEGWYFTVPRPTEFE